MKNIKTILILLFIGIVLGIAATVYFEKKYDLLSTSADVYEETNVSSEPSPIADGSSLSASDLDLTPAFVEDEMARNGRIVRVKTAGSKVPDQQRESTEIKAEIKRVYAQDPVLANSKITVLVRKGKVTLTGPKLPPGYIGRAIVLAYNVEGVSSVISTLEIKPKQK